MNAGEISGHLHPTGEPVRLAWRDGKITNRDRPDREPADDHWLAPPLVDLQVNGYAGVDFQQDNLDTADLLRARLGLLNAGCTRWLLTLTTDRWPRMIDRLERLRSLRDTSDELRQTIVGWHIEGPFLSTEPGYHGAHDPDCMLDPTPERIRQLRSVTGYDPLLLTLAPERPGAIQAIELAVSLGIRISLGHTNADAATIETAVAAGAACFTHLGNACPGMIDRHDNILWRALDSPIPMVSLIPDGIHVSPALFRLIHRLLGPKRICLVTDAMAAAGAPPGRYTLGTVQVEVGPDQVVRQPGRTNYAGSALRPIDGLFRAAAMLGCSWRDVWPAFSDRPAQIMGLSPALQPGANADFCLVRPDRSQQGVEVQLFRAGQKFIQFFQHARDLQGPQSPR